MDHCIVPRGIAIVRAYKKKSKLENLSTLRAVRLRMEQMTETVSEKWASLHITEPNCQLNENNFAI